METPVAHTGPRKTQLTMGHRQVGPTSLPQNTLSRYVPACRPPPLRVCWDHSHAQPQNQGNQGSARPTGLYWDNIICHIGLKAFSRVFSSQPKTRDTRQSRENPLTCGIYKLSCYPLIPSMIVHNCSPIKIMKAWVIHKINIIKQLPCVQNQEHNQIRIYHACYHPSCYPQEYNHTSPTILLPTRT